MGADFRKGQNDPRNPQVREGIRRRQEAAARDLSSRERAMQASSQQRREFERDQAMRRAAQSQAPQQSPPPGFEEATFRRNEVEKARGGLGRRASFLDQRRAQEQSYERERQLRNKFEGQPNEMRRRSQAQPTGNMRSGMVFGPGRSMRMPEAGSSEYQQILNRLRSMRGGN